MIDLIPGITFTDTEKQVYGSIFGAVLGASVGTLTAFFIGNRERNKQEDIHKLRLNRALIQENAKGLQSAELTLTDLMMKCEANNEYVTNIKQGLVKKDGEKNLALMQLNTPFDYPKPDPNIAQQILNGKIVILWGNLCQEIELQNKNVNDFAEFYKVLFSTIHTSLLKKEQLAMSVIASDNQTIKMGMDQQLDANTILRIKCINLLAHVDCFVAHIKGVDTRSFKTLEQYRSFINEIAKYEPAEAELEKAREHKNKTYDPKVMFKSTSIGNSKKKPMN
ncbi:hypothetical protein [Pedobacter sp.]|uniref:hypothetical protein n=1 Tax=Pedobacter sp. TaxID=1411316 RepID=UPI003D7FB821